MTYLMGRVDTLFRFSCHSQVLVVSAEVGRHEEIPIGLKEEGK